MIAGCVVEVAYEEEDDRGVWVPCRQVATVVSETATTVTVDFGNTGGALFVAPLSSVRLLDPAAQPSAEDDAPAAPNEGDETPKSQPQHEPSSAIAQMHPAKGLAGCAELWVGGLLDIVVTFFLGAVAIATGGSRVKALVYLAALWTMPSDIAVWVFFALCYASLETRHSSKEARTVNQAMGSYVHSARRLGQWADAMAGRSMSLTTGVTGALLAPRFLGVSLVTVVAWLLGAVSLIGLVRWR